MAIGDVARVVATFTGTDTQLVQWVWHYVVTAGGTQVWDAIADAIVAQLATAFDEIDLMVENGYTGNTLEVLLYDSGANEFNGVALKDISTIDGGADADALPANVAPYVTFFTDIPKSRGKKFIFGWIETQIADGVVSAAGLAALALFAAHFNNVVTDGSSSLAPGNFNAELQRFLTWSASEIGVGVFSGSQYRRLPGRGA
jgi:hypothetical protein